MSHWLFNNAKEDIVGVVSFFSHCFDLSCLLPPPPPYSPHLPPLPHSPSLLYLFVSILRLFSSSLILGFDCFLLLFFFLELPLGLSDGYNNKRKKVSEGEWGRVRKDEGILNEEHIQLLKLLCTYRTGLPQASPSMLGCNYNSTSY